MSLLFESIKIVNGEIHNLPYHQSRMKKAFKELFSSSICPDLGFVLDQKEIPDKGIYKCKVIYDEEVKEVSFHQYHKREIQNFILVADDNIQYNYKWYNRRVLIDLKKNFLINDEVIILKDGLITDTTFSNIVFYNGAEWFTPKTPLLKGTKRQQLLEMGKIRRKNIRVQDLKGYSHLRLINAMLGFDGSNEYDISAIRK